MDQTLRAGALAAAGPVLGNPALNVLGGPHLAHAQLAHGLGEVGPGHELLHALATHAQQFADLGGAHEVMHDGDHRHETSGHLTSGQRTTRISHVTSGLELRKYTSANAGQVTA